MIRKLLITWVLALGLSQSAFAEGFYQCDQIIKKEAYEACYNYKLKGTLWVIQTLKKSDLYKKGHSRKGIRFYEETSIPKKYRATLADYRGSGYDRGHLASNASLDHDKKLQKQSYSLVNITPQTPQMNRLTMKYTESLTRRLAQSNGEAIVITGNVFERINPKRIGPGRIAVPKYSYKISKYPNGKSVAFLIPNVEKGLSKKPSTYRVSIEQIQKMTGFKF